MTRDPAADPAPQACATCGLLFIDANGPRPEFYDREGHAFCSWNCAHPPRGFKLWRWWRRG
jgi:hypothetical protein